MSDWSSDVCSSDLSFISAPDSPDETEQAVPRLRRGRGAGQGAAAAFATPKLFQADAVAATGLVDRQVARSHRGPNGLPFTDRKSVGYGKRVSERVSFWGRRIINNKKQPQHK